MQIFAEEVMPHITWPRLALTQTEANGRASGGLNGRFLALHLRDFHGCR